MITVVPLSLPSDFIDIDPPKCVVYIVASI